MTTISLKVPKHLLVLLEKESKSRKVSKSELIRESLEGFLAPSRAEKSKSFYDITRQFAGAIKGGPGDLSTNPKYMEGYGR